MDDIIMNRDRCFLRKVYLKNLFLLVFSTLGGTINGLADSVQEGTSGDGTE